jgi:hypothetical protein
MTLREAMRILELNERTLEISMVESAAKERMRLAVSNTEQDQILEAYRRVQIFLDPSADERFLMRGSNVLVALSDTQDQSLASAQDKTLGGISDDASTPDLLVPLFVASAEIVPPEHSLAPTQPSTLPEIPNADARIDAGLEPTEPESVLANGSVEPDSNSVESDLDFDVDLSFEAPKDERLLPGFPEITLPKPAMSSSAMAFLDEVPVMDEMPLVLDDPPLSTVGSQPHEQADMDPAKTLESSPEFDDALLQPRTVPQDTAALTVIEEKPRAPQTKQRPSSQSLQASPSNDRRVSRAAQVTGVRRIYEKNQAKPTQSPPLWAWVLAAALVVGTGIFAAPTLLRQFGAPATKPQLQNTLSVPTLPTAPKPSPSSTNKSVIPSLTKVTPSAVKPTKRQQASTSAKPTPKPVSNQAVKARPPVVKPTAPVAIKTASQPVAVVAPKPQTSPKPTPKSQVAKPKPPVVDAQSAANLPPIGVVKPVVKPTPKPAVKPSPKPVVKPAVKPTPKPAVKPSPKPAVKPTPKPVVVAQEPKPEPVVATTPAPVVQPSPPAETIDPNNLTREQIGRRFLNEKYFEAWVTREAKLRYPSWADVPLAIQVLSLIDFQKAVLISF